MNAKSLQPDTSSADDGENSERPSDVRLLKTDPNHLCLDIKPVPGGLVVTAVCRASTYKRTKRIVASNKNGRTTLMYRPLPVKNPGYRHYEAFIPYAVLSGRTTFAAIAADRRSGAVWTAGSRTIHLPEKWRFSQYHLHLQYDPAPPPPATDTLKCYLRNISQSGDDLVIDLTMLCSRPEDLEGAKLSILRFRDEDKSVELPLEFERAKTPFRVPSAYHRKYLQLQTFYASVKIPVGAFDTAWIYSIPVRFADGRLRGIYPYNRRYAEKQSTFFWETEDTLKIVYQFSDYSTNNLRLEYFEVPARYADEVRQLLDPATKPPQSNLWLLGEYTNKARDNGWRLFQHLRENRPDIDARYVITEENADGVVPDGEHILRYGSIEHLRASRHARANLFTHHAIYVLPRLISDVTLRAGRPPMDYFLQHGVLALKPMLDHYTRKKQKTYTLFNVSSDWEQALVVRETGWNAEDITVAGLPRWDALSLANARFEAGGGTPDGILVFPTWRNILEKMPVEEFVATPYYTDWMAALTTLAVKCAAAGVRLDFCPHSNFQQFLGTFDVPGVRNIDVREAIENLPGYAMLVTDYSSLTFDFLYLRKPTTFFMFDRDEFFASEPPYIDVNTEFPGDTALTAEELAEKVFDRNGRIALRSPEELEAYRQQFFRFDQSGGNCERIIAAALDRIALQDAKALSALAADAQTSAAASTTEASDDGALQENEDGGAEEARAPHDGSDENDETPASAREVLDD